MKKKIISDFIRPSCTDDNILRLKRILKLQGEDCCFLLPKNKSYRIWLENFNKLSSQYSESLLRVVDYDSLYIGWELPPSLCDFFKENQISFMSFGVSPIRILDDFDLYVVSNIDIDCSVDWCCYMRSKSTGFLNSLSYDSIKKYDCPKEENYIMGQLPLDAASIMDGRFCGISDVINRFNLKSYMHIAHPHSKVAGKKVFKFPGLAYSMLKYNNEANMYTFSSSLQYESYLFDRKLDINSVHDYYKVYRDNHNFGFLNIESLELFLNARFDEKKIKEILDVRW